MYERKECQILKTRLEEPRRFLQVLVGPRQVGKTTLVRQLLDGIKIPHVYFSADAVPATTLGWVGDSWELARTRMRMEHCGEYLLVIDEIQKIESWSEAVKKEWDADTFNGINMKVLLLGSSRVMLEKGLSESMSGRFEEVRIGHWRLDEMESAFGWSVEEYLYYGGYPGAAPLVGERERWADYIGASIIDATIHKDIFMGASVAKPALLRQTFELGASYSGKILSYTKMLGALQDAGNTTTLSGYLSLLDTAGMLSALPKCAVDTARRRASPPKFQVHDNALRSRYASRTLEEMLSSPGEWGHCVESAVGAHLVNQSFVKNYDVMYWRDGDDEVDFVLKKGERLVAIEVKSNRETHTSSMSRFRERFNPYGILLVGPEGIGIREFLLLNPLELFR